MACCGQTIAGRLTISQQDLDDGLTLQLEYLGGRTVHVTGPVSGQVYEFSGLQRVQNIDPRDVTAILRSRNFRLKGISRGTGK